MPAKVVVVYVKHTGHILAAVTRVTDPGGTTNLDQVVTPSLRVRLLDPASTVGPPGNAEFTIPKEHLGTIIVDEENDLLQKPRTFKLADPSKPSSTLEKLPTKATTLPDIPTTGQIPESTLTPTGASPKEPPRLRQNQLEVTLAYRPGSKPPDIPTPVWALVRRNADSFQTVFGDIAPNADTVTIPLRASVTVNDYFDILVLAGRSPVYAKNVMATA
jgi:hypothetical protein